jgi:protein-L-isoaspartate(D-aspartate) O-methyltransferase
LAQAPAPSAAPYPWESAIAAAKEDPVAGGRPTAPRLSETLPAESEQDYVEWMLAHTSEDRAFVERKWERSRVMLQRQDIAEGRVLKAFLYTPREYFARRYNLRKAYDDTAIPIGYGQTISGPHMVGHMTSSVDPRRGDRVLEIGTGSGYQSALLSELSDHVYTIEIVPALFQETDQIYRKLAGRYPEYAGIARKNADGYGGWPEFAPFQKIIVTAGIDHIPPPLLRQLAPNGVMVIPVGPPSGQTVLRVVKRPLPGGGFAFERSDIYRGRKVVFVPFTSQGGSRHSLDDASAGGAP